MLDLYQYENVAYGQTEDYLKVISNVETMILNSKDTTEKEKLFRFLNVLLQVHGARTPTTEYLLKQLATAEKRDIITTGNLLHLGNCTQTEDQSLLVSPNHLLFSVEETASMLGVGRDTVLAWAREDPTFPAFRNGMGRNAPIRVNAAGLQPWIDEQCKGEV